MKPMIDAISEKEQALRACAEIATMRRTQGLSQSARFNNKLRGSHERIVTEGSQQLYQLRDLVVNLRDLMEPISRLDGKAV